MSDIETKARQLLAYECPECGGENGHESEDGWLRCSRCSNPHDVTRHQAMQAIIAALTPPEGYVLVPVDRFAKLSARWADRAERLEENAREADSMGGMPNTVLVLERKAAELRQVIREFDAVLVVQPDAPNGQ